jgi:hypothetical protein
VVDLLKQVWVSDGNEYIVDLELESIDTLQGRLQPFLHLILEAYDSIILMKFDVKGIGDGFAL